MRKAFYFVLTLLIMSCSGAKSTSGIPGKKTLKGTWQVNNIKFEGDKGLYKANMFDFADSACFKNSEWVFIPNNGSGKFTTTANGSQCEVQSNRIHWSYFDGGNGKTQFQFYLTDAKGKRIDAAKSGYRADIDALNENTMVMRVNTTYEGNPFDVVMTFNKVSDNVTL
ncbi:lipocalin family protein [Gelidibacter mesophilus]|uniref:lipocalin family protein n=1 Tax=Gelidibacter mesophilus TaxID=169050 RepID=UPI000408B95F|nr:lipocalin family protein [Gelidibacter mesophilus]